MTVYYVTPPDEDTVIEAWQEGDWYYSYMTALATADQLSSYGVEEYRVFSLTIQEE